MYSSSYYDNYNYSSTSQKDQYLVKTPYGTGLVIRTRSPYDFTPNNEGNENTCDVNNDMIKEIRLLELEKNQIQNAFRPAKPTMLYTTIDYPSAEIKQGDDVMTPYGRGKVLNIVTVRIRSKVKVDKSLEENKNDGEINDGSVVDNISNDESNLSNQESSSSEVLTSPTIATVDDTQIGEDNNLNQDISSSSSPPLQTQQQHEKEERTLTKYQIQLTSWRLANRSLVKCYLFQSPSIRLVRKKTLGEMSPIERVEFAQNQKQAAQFIFSNKEYQHALNIYAGAIDAIRYVQHDSNSTNECRADLVEVMVTCSNNAATCCVQLRQWALARRYAQNALVLLDALFSKRGFKIHAILCKDNGLCDAKLFGEWRIKSYLIIAKSYSEEMEDYALAIDTLKKARDIITYFTTGEGNDTSTTITNNDSDIQSSISRLKIQEREVVKLSNTYLEKKKKILKKEKARAQAMFGGSSLSTKKKKDESQDKNTESQNDIEKSNPKRTKESTNPINMNGSASSFETFDSKESDLSNSKPKIKKRVSFSPVLEDRRILDVKDKNVDDDDEEEDDTEPWYEEHKEALILAAVAGLATFTAILLRKR